MKHHKAKGVWVHKPDAIPLEDKPSMGPKRKKGPLQKASKKHLWDHLKQGMKDMQTEVKWAQNSWCGEWATTRIEGLAGKMETLFLELERRM